MGFPPLNSHEMGREVCGVALARSSATKHRAEKMGQWLCHPKTDWGQKNYRSAIHISIGLKLPTNQSISSLSICNIYVSFVLFFIFTLLLFQNQR